MSPKILKVLLLEDDKLDASDFLNGIEHYAEKESLLVEVDWTYRYKDAYEALQEKQYDAMVTDLHVGLDAPRPYVKMIANFRAITSIPIIAMSGVYNSKKTEEIIRAGVDDFLLKGSNGYDRVLRSILLSIARHERMTRMVLNGHQII